MTMGRYYWDQKNTVEESHSVSVAFLRKHGYFSGLCSGVITWTNHWGEQTASVGVTVCAFDGGGHVRFRYTHTRRSTGEETQCDYKVPLVTTPCHFGGVRWWFLCPLSRDGIYCGRRVGKLYLPPGGVYYGCRHCYDLSYESRNEPRLARPGGIGYALVLERQYEDLYGRVKRWTYRGRPTRKAKRLRIIEARLDACCGGSLRGLL